MLKIITFDYLKRSCSASLSSEMNWGTESDVQTSRKIHINDEKSTNKDNESIPVECQPGPDYSFQMKQFGRKNVVWKKTSLLVQQLFLASLFLLFCVFCIKHSRKLTAEHNMKEAYITKVFNNWKKALEAFIDHQQSKEATAATTYESVVPQCGDVLEMTVTDLNHKRLAKKKVFG